MTYLFTLGTALELGCRKTPDQYVFVIFKWSLKTVFNFILCHLMTNLFQLDIYPTYLLGKGNASPVVCNNCCVMEFHCLRLYMYLYLSDFWWLIVFFTSDLLSWCSVILLLPLFRTELCHNRRWEIKNIGGNQSKGKIQIQNIDHCVWSSSNYWFQIKPIGIYKLFLIFIIFAIIT